MRLSAIISGLFGLFCLVGGAIGFIKAHSVVSLVIGCISCVLLLSCALATWNHRRAGAFVALFIALLLGARFGIAYLHDPKIMPHLVMIGFSTLSVVTTLWALVRKPAFARLL